MGTSLADLLGSAKDKYGPQAGINLLRGGEPVPNKSAGVPNTVLTDKAMGQTMADIKKALGEPENTGPAVEGPDGLKYTKDAWTMPVGSYTYYFVNATGAETPTPADLIMVSHDDWSKFKNAKDPKVQQEILSRYPRPTILGGQ